MLLDTNDFISLFNKGSNGAFRLLYEHYYTAMCNYCNYIIKDKIEARDIVQDVFLSLWTRRKTFQTTNNIRAFLYASTRNASLNRIKHRKVKLEYEKLFKENDFEDSTALDVIIRTEVSRQLMNKLNELPKECGKVLKLSIQGKSYKEISDIMGISINTVKNNRIRAIKILKSRLSNHDFSILLIILQKNRQRIAHNIS